MTAKTERYDVGGVMLERPFQVRRLGHFLFQSRHIEKFYDFYINLLGFLVTDEVDMAHRMKPEVAATIDDTKLYFSRYGGDHHAFIFSSENMSVARGRSFPPKVTIGQLSWLVGSLQEVVEGEEWLDRQSMEISKSGRDTPGSNYHTYVLDPFGHPNEILYGMEQIGWDGRSKPKELWRPFLEAAPLPQVSEYQEVQDGMDRGIDMDSGYRHVETLPFEYEVDGIKMPRPFKVTAIGPVRLMVPDMEKALHFYVYGLGFKISEEVEWNGHKCYFLRAKSDHHDLALYPEAIGADLGLSDHSYCMSFGCRLYNYRQLKDAIAFLESKGVEIKYLPKELTPGMDYTAFAVDPDGHLVQLYCYMEQIGWDGKPRPAEQRREIDLNNWPETIDAASDQVGPETFMGPWL